MKAHTLKGRAPKRHLLTVDDFFYRTHYLVILESFGRSHPEWHARLFERVEEMRRR